MLSLLTTPAALAALRADPAPLFETVFAAAHAAIAAAFTEASTAAGYAVSRAAEGYLVRKRAGNVFCVHGGSTATVVAILDGRRVVCANVGDSGALLCGGAGAPPVELRPAEEWTPLEPAAASPAPSGSGAGSEGGPDAAGDAGGAAGDAAGGGGGAPAAPFFALELTTDHTPESAEEFTRVAAARPSASGARGMPDALFVYDVLSVAKAACPGIFELRGGAPVKTGRGSYYKNVRSEWATLVATPPHAAFQDALAFTRSLGDFHLQSYGVAHAPAVRWAALPARGAGAGAGAHALALVLASDGLWDNWLPADVAAAALAPRSLAAARAADAPAVQAAVDALLDANLARAAANFGDSADNMTVLVAWLVE